MKRIAHVIAVILPAWYCFAVPNTQNLQDFLNAPTGAAVSVGHIQIKNAPPSDQLNEWYVWTAMSQPEVKNFLKEVRAGGYEPEGCPLTVPPVN